MKEKNSQIKRHPARKGGRGGTVAWDPPKQDVLEALYECRGVASQAAKALMVNPVTLYRYLERNPEVYEELQLIRTSEREKLLDASEHVIAKTLAGEDERLALDAAKFTLDRTGKARGWVTKKVTEHQGAGGGEIKVKVEYEDKRQLDDAIDVEHRDLDEEDGSTDDQPE